MEVPPTVTRDELHSGARVKVDHLETTSTVEVDDVLVATFPNGDVEVAISGRVIEAPDEPWREGQSIEATPHEIVEVCG